MTTDVASQIAALDTLFERTLTAMDQARASKSVLDQDLRAVTGHPHDGLKWDPDARDLVEKEVRNLAWVVVRMATDHLSVRGARPEIDIDEHLATYPDAERAIRNRWRDTYDTTIEQMMSEIEAVWRAFRPSGLWAEIAARYSPAAVAAQAASRAANCLVATFQLAHRPQPRLVKGRVELEIAIRPQRQHDGLSLRYERQRLYLFGEAFETFALSEFPDDTSGLASVGNSLASQTEVKVRDRLDLGAGVEAVIYLSAIKLYIPAHVAEALNQFVTLHAASAFALRPAA